MRRNPINIKHGDVGQMGFEHALNKARRRAMERGCRQEVRQSRSIRSVWFIQDVR